MLPSWNHQSRSSQKQPANSTSESSSSSNQWHSQPGFPMDARRRLAEQEAKIDYDPNIFRDWDATAPAATAGRWQEPPRPTAIRYSSSQPSPHYSSSQPSPQRSAPILIPRDENSQKRAPRRNSPVYFRQK